MFSSAINLLKRHKETLSFLGSVVALILSIYTYVSQNLWNVHDVEVYATGEMMENIQDRPIYVILRNSGKRNETILSVDMSLEKTSVRGSTEEVFFDFAPSPVVLEPSSTRAFEIPGTKEHLTELNHSQSDAFAPDNTPVSYGARITFISPNGRISKRFFQIGQVTYLGGMARSFDPFGGFSNESKRLF